MTNLKSDHHVFRHLKKTWTDGDFIDPAAFRLASVNGGFENGVSVNWMEFFKQVDAASTIAPLVAVLEKKRDIGGQSKFAQLNVGKTVEAAAKYCAVSIVLDEEPNDKSHALIMGHAPFNDQVAEAISKTIIAIFPAK